MYETCSCKSRNVLGLQINDYIVMFPLRDVCVIEVHVSAYVFSCLDVLYVGSRLTAYPRETPKTFAPAFSAPGCGAVLQNDGLHLSTFCVAPC